MNSTNLIISCVICIILVLSLSLGVGIKYRQKHDHSHYSDYLSSNQDNTEFYFYIRGHIRNSFKTNRLKKFIRLVQYIFPNVKFILQTWSEQECKKGDSYKNIKENNNIINKTIIYNYFEDADMINNCVIIDSNNIQLIGSTEGKISASSMPVKGWKNMWYGIHKGLEQIDDYDYDKLIVSFRYDYFDIPQTIYNENQIINFIKQAISTKQFSFIQRNGTPGIDNLYIGTVQNMKSLSNKFHYNLDNILKETINKNVLFHEQIVYNIANI